MNPFIDRRRSRREPVQVPASLSFSNRRRTDCSTLDLSESGARLLIPRTMLLPGEFELSVPARKLKRLARLVWRRDDETGVMFV